MNHEHEWRVAYTGKETREGKTVFSATSMCSTCKKFKTEYGDDPVHRAPLQEGKARRNKDFFSGLRMSNSQN